MSTDSPPPTPDELREMRAMKHLIDDGPMTHKCDICRRNEIGTVSRWPVGWRMLAIGEGWESLEDVDNDTQALCSFCAAIVLGALEECEKRLSRSVGEK